MASLTFYGISELFVLEETPKGHLVQLPRNEQGHLQQDEVAQSLVQPDFECRQGQGINHLSGQTVPASNASPLLFIKKIILKSNLNLPSSSLKAFPLVLSQKTLLKSPLV